MVKIRKSTLIINMIINLIGIILSAISGIFEQETFRLGWWLAIIGPALIIISYIEIIKRIDK